MSMGGKGPEVLVTLTTDFGKILDGLHRTKIRGETHLATGIQVAGVSALPLYVPLAKVPQLTSVRVQLALKHRQNKSQRQRIIVFTCSTIAEDEKTLVKLAKKMKKNNISIDFVLFGELEGDNTKKLEAFTENVKSGDGSHLAIIPPGPNLLSDSLLTTPIMQGEGGGATGGSSGDTGAGPDTGPGGFDYGSVDPSVDPELAMVLRMSYEEDLARKEREKEAREKEEKDNADGQIKKETKQEGEEESKPLLEDVEEKNGTSPKEEPNNKDDDSDKMDLA